MEFSPPQWHPAPVTPAPAPWREAVQAVCPKPLRGWAAQVLWQRQIVSLDDLTGFLDASAYTPTPASAFGPPMVRAVERLKQAIDRQETVTIWGDFDADGVTATAVLWDGLGPWFEPGKTLRYYIPNRLRESHGLSQHGLDQVREWGTDLIVTCDTGSTNLEEVAYAQSLGMAVIITDHHTLPPVEPAALAIINPRTFPADHPLATLSGVAVAYKLLEALYEALGNPSDFRLEYLLDLVAIGLIADLVNLTGDCRYLAQRGLKQLRTQQQAHPPYPRPGLKELLALCKKTGDRPTDISFGLGPRINAVSRIHGDARFCVELLTSRDDARCQALAREAELANTRRKGLQREVYDQVMQRVTTLDLSTTHGLVLADEQWPTGILGLVAGQVSQALGRPTILLTIDPPGSTPQLARGSARSVPGLDLYDLFQSQADLLTSFGGHPLAAGLTLPVERLAMFTTAINRAIRERLGSGVPRPQLAIDLTVTVADLGPSLFQELNLLEPYGMGHPVPRLLLRDVWFAQTRQENLTDARERKVRFIKTTFVLGDDTVQTGCLGEWWGHYVDELPKGRCDVVVELDHSLRQGYHVKLVDVRPGAASSTLAQPDDENAGDPVSAADPPWLTVAPAMIPRLSPGIESARDGGSALQPSPVMVWQQLAGMAKYLARTQTAISRTHLRERLGLSDITLNLGLQALASAGFHPTPPPDTRPQDGVQDRVCFQTSCPSPASPGHPPHDPDAASLQHFLEAVAEDQFRQRYRWQHYAQSTLR